MTSYLFEAPSHFSNYQSLNKKHINGSFKTQYVEDFDSIIICCKLPNDKKLFDGSIRLMK
ncbi:17194_t:CDS:2 [Funneliformis caledonium]|uniref:17194_t:CDS:1 n=1 Tax=Funneliformis caledonium TaxID=1117310 RepID=A0A9N8Z9C1_9GLOM|nr:17194_t:CDS:2 [Funneliformis caledonium]